MDLITVGLVSLQLTVAVTSLLQKYLNFAVASKSLSVNIVVLATEEA